MSPWRSMSSTEALSQATQGSEDITGYEVR